MSSISTRNKGLSRTFVAITLYAVSQQVMAAAFALKEQSVTYLGNAFAGTASAAEPGADTGYYNPAALVELKHSQAMLGATYIGAKLKLQNATARNNIGTAVTNSGNSATPKSRGLVPGLHLAWVVNHKWALGFSVSAPFGLNTKYNNTDIARYMALESRITTISYSPSVSYRVNDQFSVGAGFDAMQAKATLSSSLNFGAEGYSINKAHGWSYGYHAGILFKPSSITKMGLVYFSKFDPGVTGTVQTFRYPTSAPTSLISKVHLPDRIVYGVTYQYNDQWTGMGELEWTHWSRFKSLTLTYNASSPVSEYFFYKNISPVYDDV